MSAYRHMMAKVGGVLLLATAMAAVAAPTAEAAAMLRLASGATTVTVTDGGAGDANPVAGVITFIGGVGGFQVNVSTSLTKPFLGTAANPRLHLDSTSTSTNGGGSITISHTDTGFTHLGNFSMAFATTTNGTASYSAYFDQSNTPFGVASLIDTIGPFGGPAASGTGGGGTTSVSPYSLTQIVTIVHGASVKTTSIDADLIPEPATLALFGIGLLGVGATSRRLRRAQKTTA